MEPNVATPDAATRTMQYAVAEAARRHAEREAKITEVAEYILEHQDAEKSKVLAHFIIKYAVSRSAVNGYYDIAVARNNGTAKAKAAGILLGGPNKPILVDGVRYYSNAAAARYLRIHGSTLHYWANVGKGIEPSTITSPKNGKVYQLYSRANVDAWKETHADLLAKVERVKPEPKLQAKSSKRAKTIRRPLLDAQHAGLLVGSNGLAAYFGVPVGRLKHYLKTRGRPEHSVIQRPGKAAYGYTQEQADAWAGAHSALGLVGKNASGVKTVRKFNPITHGSPGNAIGRRTQELTEARDRAQAALDSWNERLEKLFSDV